MGNGRKENKMDDELYEMLERTSVIAIAEFIEEMGIIQDLLGCFDKAQIILYILNTFTEEEVNKLTSWVKEEGI